MSTPTSNNALELSGRSGERPRTGPEIPHQQLDQIAPAELQQELWRRMAALAGGPDRAQRRFAAANAGAASRSGTRARAA